MFPISGTFMIICLIFILSLLTSTVVADFNQTKALCYTGSSLYQLVTQNCNDKDPSYKGTWYCAKMEICEPYMSSSRQCITTRGCATEDQCADSSSTSGIYSGNTVTVNGLYPAGMKVTATCCAAHNFPNDDTIAIDYNDICNTASSTSRNVWFTVSAVLLSVAMAFLYQ